MKSYRRKFFIPYVSIIFYLLLTACSLLTFSGCGGGGGGDTSATSTTSASTSATLTGYALVPSSTPTQSAKAPFFYALKTIFIPSLSAASSTKPLDNASVSVAKINSDGTLTAVSSTTVATDEQGKYTLSDVPEGTNLVVVAAKNVKDDAGAEKTVTLGNLVSVLASDIGKTKEGADMKVDTTLAVENIKELIAASNEGKSESEKIDGSNLSSDKVDEIKKIFENYISDISGKLDTADIITRDKNKPEKDHHKDIIAMIEELKNEIAGLKAELETKINEILSSGAITGFIKDASGNAISTATVTVTGGGLTGSKAATVFSTGQYTISVPTSTAAYTVTISLSGYKSASFTVFISELMTWREDITLTPSSSPTISGLSASQTTVTSGGQITLTCNAADTDGDSVTCSWSADGGALSATTGNSVTYTAPTTTGTYTITLTVSDGTNSTTATKTITVVSASTSNSNPAISTAAPSATTGTAPLTVTFSASATDDDGNIVSYYWDFGDGKTSNEIFPTHVYTSSGTYTATLTVTDNQGGTATSQAITITVSEPENQTPSVTVSALPSSGSAPLTVSFSATATDSDGTIASAQWDYNGDGNADWTTTQSSDGYSTSYTFTSAATYTATFKATDNKGASATKSVTITVGASNKAPTASASASPTSGTVPLSVQFTGTCADVDGSCSSYSWDFGDGTSSTEQNPSKTYSTAGSYAVKFTATDNGGASANATVVVTASLSSTNQPPTASLSADKTSGNTPLTVSFTIGYTDPEGKAGTYSLNAGDNSTVQTGSINSGATATVNQTYSTAGTYTATLTVTDDKGASSAKSLSIIVFTPTNQPPSASLTASPASGTSPLNVTFTISYTDPEGAGGTYSLNLGDNSTAKTGSITSGQNTSVSHTYQSAGTYTVALTVTDDKGAIAIKSATINVTTSANQSPSATLSASVTSGTSPLAETFTVSYTDPEGKAGTYTIDYGDNSGTASGSINSGSSAQTQHTYTCSTSTCAYTATLTVTDDGGATDTKTLSVSVTASTGDVNIIFKNKKAKK